jgi:5-methylcytosine-specific restriction enzyme subunit McrC
MDRIPIKNIYYLICYAWDVLPHSELVDVNRNDFEKPIDLFVNALIHGTQRLLRRGAHQDYQEKTEELSTLRGRVMVSKSANRFLFQQAKAICVFDELTHNNLPNQIIKTTLFRLCRNFLLDKELRKECTTLVRQFGQVDLIRLSKASFRQIQLNANNRIYRLLLNICELLLDSALLDESSGPYRFYDFLRQNGLMADLYEKFLFNFYEKEQSEYKVSSPKIRWLASSQDDPELEFLPMMETDITLQKTGRILIMDAKYYGETLQVNFFSQKQTFRSGHLYQIFSYLENHEDSNNKDVELEGVLLYPTISSEISRQYKIKNHAVRLETVNLAAEWQEIHNRLLQIANIANG